MDEVNEIARLRVGPLGKKPTDNEWIRACNRFIEMIGDTDVDNYFAGREPSCIDGVDIYFIEYAVKGMPRLGQIAIFGG